MALPRSSASQQLSDAAGGDHCPTVPARSSYCGLGSTTMTAVFAERLQFGEHCGHGCGTEAAIRAPGRDRWTVISACRIRKLLRCRGTRQGHEGRLFIATRAIVSLYADDAA